MKSFKLCFARFETTELSSLFQDFDFIIVKIGNGVGFGP